LAVNNRDRNFTPHKRQPLRARSCNAPNMRFE
jgi:hypothetical protein